jgi:hypothetical protein
MLAPDPIENWFHANQRQTSARSSLKSIIFFQKDSKEFKEADLKMCEGVVDRIDEDRFLASFHFPMRLS